MLKKIISSILAVTLLASSASLLTVGAKENKTDSTHSAITSNIESTTKENTEKIKSITEEKTSKSETITEENTSELELISTELNSNIATYYDQDGNQVDPTALNADVEIEKKLPSSYDLRDYGRSTSVKNQESFGTCWDFASTASMESNILTQGLNNETADTLNLSEAGNTWYLHTNTTDTSSPVYNEYVEDPDKGAAGGNSLLAADSISSGYGTYPEELINYNSFYDSFSMGYPESYRFYSDYRLKDYTELDPTNIDLVKQRIMDVDDKCLVEEFVGKIKSVDINGKQYTPADGSLIMDKTTCTAKVDVNFEEYKHINDFIISFDLAKKGVIILNYQGASTDVTIPSELYSAPVMAIDDEFSCLDENFEEIYITSITIPGTVKSIPERLLSYSPCLESVVLEEGIEEIGNYAFSGCNLNSIDLPDSLRSIGDLAFFNNNIKSVVLGKNIEKIGDKALGYTYSLRKLDKIEDFVISGYAGTAAEEYAKANGFTFVDLSNSEQTDNTTNETVQLMPCA